MMLRRWTLHADPVAPEWGYLASLFTDDERFFTRRGAGAAAHFYQFTMCLPLRFSVVRRKP